MGQFGSVAVPADGENDYDIECGDYYVRFWNCVKVACTVEAGYYCTALY